MVVKNRKIYKWAIFIKYIMADYQAQVKLNLEAETLRGSKAYEGMVTDHRVLSEENRYIHLDNPSTNSSRGVITFDPTNPWIHYSTIEDNGILDVTLYKDGSVEFSLKPFLFEMKQTLLRKLFRMGPKIKKREETTPTEGRLNGVDFL